MLTVTAAAVGGRLGLKFANVMESSACAANLGGKAGKFSGLRRACVSARARLPGEDRTKRKSRRAGGHRPGETSRDRPPGPPARALCHITGAVGQGILAIRGMAGRVAHIMSLSSSKLREAVAGMMA